nr:DUF2231 domain-containing protein [Pelomonas sp. P8]
MIDWLAIPRGTRAKSVGALHATRNVLVLALFGANAWLGGELVDRLGVGGSDIR